MEILKFNPCKDAVEFRKQFPTFGEAWQSCPRGDWMLWIAKKLNVDDRLLTLAKGRCAETVIHLMNDNRSINAVKAAIAYGNSEITADELASAASAAAYAASAAYAAAYAASAAYAAAYAAAYDYATADAAGEENKLQTAEICRVLLTDAVMEKINL